MLAVTLVSRGEFIAAYYRVVPVGRYDHASPSDGRQIAVHRAQAEPRGMHTGCLHQALSTAVHLWDLFAPELGGQGCLSCARSTFTSASRAWYNQHLCLKHFWCKVCQGSQQRGYVLLFPLLARPGWGKERGGRAQGHAQLGAQQFARPGLSCAVTVDHKQLPANPVQSPGELMQTERESASTAVGPAPTPLSP